MYLFQDKYSKYYIFYDLINRLILEHKGIFENKWAKHIDEHDVYGTTVKRKMYETDEKERYIHIYHSINKESGERTLLAKRLRQMK